MTIAETLLFRVLLILYLLFIRTYSMDLRFSSNGNFDYVTLAASSDTPELHVREEAFN